MHISGAQGKILVPKYEEGLIILNLRDEDDKEIESVNMDKETASLLSVLVNSGVIEAEMINKRFKREGIKLQKIQDIGTCFVNDGRRVSIAILPADEKRTASILIGFHREDNHSSIIVKPKRAAYLSMILTKIVISNIE
ncbi:hypothetical protein [Methanococcus aeolicus]|uniref:Uncharacterized protein n=1 Tax=Methanococcus aeolicus (strain ATCC BAA-1280 / DSM 17508 / OCM 812 / Nankai-3) TaxID=419665 RepID=A6UTV7_META3|nr:hypothetical protein [Methanococcus aeolicus]ABR55929.1 conserved hypothetical protein [Methanococcus aeolicus Nankai-3]UXM85472.1 hypothetical protein N6C89_04145 [Methanococcus aeolicus]